MRIIPLILFLLLLNQSRSKCQEQDTSRILFSVAAEPFFLFNSSLKLDAEIQREGKHFSYVISPEFYSGQTIDGRSLFKSYDGDYIRGAGIGIFQKYKFRKDVFDPYFAYGLTYRNLNIKYSDEGFYSYNTDHLTYYEYGNFTDHLKINSFLVCLMLGGQGVHKSGFISDFYLGFGYKKSYKASRYPDYRKYDQSAASYAFTGLLPVFGWKIGFLFKK